MKQIILKQLAALTACFGLNLEFSAAFAQDTAFSALTITNPTPTYDDQFGYSVAAVGNDRLMIGSPHDDQGANDAGVAYLFGTNGALITTFTNPSPAASDGFGFSVAAAGADRVLIGAPYKDMEESDSGAAYLFSTTGALLTTFTNPPPATDDGFGGCVAMVGADHVIIGTPGKGPYGAGTAYLFNTNGALLLTFTNREPTANDSFGKSVAAMGTDRVLIGAPSADSNNTGAAKAGIVYLFKTDGALLATFNNPTPKAYCYFGWSVAVAANNQVLIGAPDGGSLGAGPGAAYLFSTNGALLTTFTNPTPEAYDYFGSSVAAVGNDRLLIGAYGDNAGCGAAYVFRTDGTLIHSLTNLPPESRDLFGVSMAALGSDQVLIGALRGDSGAGAAYLFSAANFTLEIPSLSIRFTNTSTVVISWPSPSAGWLLQQNTNGVLSVNWSNAPGPIQDDGTSKFITLNPPTGNRFYRLFKP